MSLQNISINIEKIIKNNKINKEYKIVKEMEDKISEIYQNHEDTEILDENKMSLLYPITNNYCNINFYKNIDDILPMFNIDENILNMKDKIVITGSAIRSTISPKDEYRKEIFISACTNINWKLVLNNFDLYEETETMYYKKHNDCIINIFKNTYNSPSEIILNGQYLKRFAYYNDVFYATPMFIIEYNTKLKYMDLNYIDPVFKTELDILDLQYPKLEDKHDIYDVINRKDYKALVHITTYDLNKLKDGLTCIEYALKLYITEECDIIQGQLKLIIFELLKYVKFKRDPGFYAELIKLDKYDLEMYEILLNPEYIKFRQSIEAFSSIDELNISILNYYIKNDMVDEFYSFIKIICKKPSSEIFNTIIETNPKKIIHEGIKKKYFSENNIYKIILMSQQLNYFNLIKFDINIAFNFIDKIIKKCLIKSFYYLYKQDKTIINLVNENNMSLMHQLEFSENKEIVEDMIRLLITLDETILNKKNNEGETPLLYHATHNVDICSILIKIIKEKNMTKLFYDKTNNNDTILHILSRSNLNLKLIKEIIYDNMDLLNEINKNNETAILISCINSAEDIYYLLNGIGADMNICDKYENNVEHYICLNEMCIGMAIQNKENIFGYTPLDYCKISPSYYYFIN
jgi:hypothetical protein